MLVGTNSRGRLVISSHRSWGGSANLRSELNITLVLRSISLVSLRKLRGNPSEVIVTGTYLKQRPSHAVSLIGNLSLHNQSCARDQYLPAHSGFPLSLCPAFWFPAGTAARVRPFVNGERLVDAYRCCRLLRADWTTQSFCHIILLFSTEPRVIFLSFSWQQSLREGYDIFPTKNKRGLHLLHSR